MARSTQSRSANSDQSQTLVEHAGPATPRAPYPLKTLQKTPGDEYQPAELGPFTRQLLNERMDALTRDVAVLEPTDPRRRVMIGELLRLMNLANILRKNR